MHRVQFDGDDEALLSPYLPASQSMHDSVGAVEYMPAAHASHRTLPFAASVFVTEPAGQCLHALVDEAEYSPIGHAVHRVPADDTTAALDALDVTTTDPAPHSSHSDACGPLYLPAGHSAHASVDAGVNRPAAQAVHLLPPVTPSVSVSEPAAHVSHAVEPLVAMNLPSGHSIQPLLSATRADSTALPYLPAPQLSHCPCPLRS